MSRESWVARGVPKTTDYRLPTTDFPLRLLGIWIAVLACVVGAGCRRDMQDQPKYKDLRGSGFFADKRSARPKVPDTVARGFLHATEVFSTGKKNGQLVAELPMPLTRELLDRGRERYGIFCSPCHGLTGNGLGVVVQRGFRQPPNLNIDRLREAPVGYFFDVETKGFGAMSDYAGSIPAADRWAIAAFVRALQLSQRTTLADVPSTELKGLESPDASPKAAPLPVDTDDWRQAPIQPVPKTAHEEKH